MRISRDQFQDDVQQGIPTSYEEPVDCRFLLMPTPDCRLSLMPTTDVGSLVSDDDDV